MEAASQAPTTGAAPSPRTLARFTRWVAPLAMCGLLALSLVVVRRELGPAAMAQVLRAMHDIPARALALASLLTVAAYLVLSGYDLLALRSIGAQVGSRIDTRIGVRRTVLVSMLSYAMSQTLGFALLTGGAVRARYWMRWGLRGNQVARAMSFVSATFIVGIASACGLALLSVPARLLAPLALPLLPARAGGAALLGMVALYVAWSFRVGSRSLGWRSWRVSVPRPAFAMAQVALALLDWGIAGAVAYALLPSGHVAIASFLGVFVLAQCVGVASHVPGGLGVFESLMLLGLHGTVETSTLLGALIAYRAIYYLVPFALALATMVVLESYGQRERIVQVVGTASSSAVTAFSIAARVARFLQPLVPSVIAMSTFAGGTMLLFSGATPAEHTRVRVLVTVLPLGLMELSHFMGSLAGVGMLVLAAALRRRLDAAWGATVALIAVGIAASLLKGLDWEEAALLSLVLVALLMSRRAFYRPAALTADVLTTGWMLGLTGVVAASCWLGLLSYRHLEYSSALWWEFAAHGNAPRFLRASAGAIVAVFTLGLWRLLRPARLLTVAPSDECLRRAEALVHAVPESTPALALLGDKTLLFSEQQDAFVMYGVSGRSWIAMGDPVGSTDRLADVAWRFNEAADAHGALPVFYQVTPKRLPLYVDLGMTLLKIGEEAVVPLNDFSLDGASHRWMRRALKDAERQQLSFEVVAPADVPALLPTLRRISDEWLSSKATREKGFSLGRFDERYLSHFPLALVRAPGEDGTRIVAFANVWSGCAGGELSPDLMRRVGDAPKATMDFLFLQLLLWGKANGYDRCNLGMAPLAGLREHALTRPELAPLWSRAGAFLYGRGESFYNFRGLRAFKEKFSPEWEPRYIAAPGGIALPRVLADVATLIAGGVDGLVRK